MITVNRISKITYWCSFEPSGHGLVISMLHATHEFNICTYLLTKHDFTFISYFEVTWNWLTLHQTFQLIRKRKQTIDNNRAVETMIDNYSNRFSCGSKREFLSIRKLTLWRYQPKCTHYRKDLSKRRKFMNFTMSPVKEVWYNQSSTLTNGSP